MKKIVVLLSVISCFTISFGQENNNKIEKEIDGLKTQINSLRSSNSNLNNELNSLESQIEKLNVNLDSLNVQVRNNESSINTKSTKLNSRITTTETKTNEKLVKVDETIGKTTLYSIIGVSLAIILSGILYWLLSKRQKTDKTHVEMQLSNAKKSIEEEQVQINTKLAELYNGQMELLKHERKANPGNDIDHSLALKVADEIVKMQMNLVHMDSKVRGHKQLTIAVTNVFDNFKANGYEIVDLLNKPYNDGMNMDASKEPDPTLNEGVQLIRRIIKPEIHYNNKMIQKAQVIVAYGE
jgi:cell division septum initiation protein DivIVA